MLRSSISATLLTFMIAFPAATTTSAHVRDVPADTTAYQRWYDALRNAAPDPERGAAVRNLALVRDVGRLELTEGDLHLFEPVDGRTVGAVFVGRGRFTFEPPIRVEQNQLAVLYGNDILVRDITTAVLFFTDETAEELSASVQWERRRPPSNARREIEEALDYLSDADGWVDRGLMMPVLNGIPGMFHAHVAESRGDPLIFAVDPGSFEEVSLSRRAKTRGKVREVISRFHQKSDIETGRSLPQERLDPLRVVHYDIENNIESNLDFEGRATITAELLAPEYTWIPFRLYDRLDVDSIRWESGAIAPHYRPAESDDFWIDFTSAPSSFTSLTVFYHGKLFERDRNFWIEIGSSSTWFPVYQFGRPSTYRLTYHAPEKFRIASVGRKVAQTTENGRTTTVFVTDVIRQTTFNIGEFEEHDVNDPRVPRLVVQIAEGAHHELASLAAERDLFLLRQRDMAGQVAADLANSFAFFNQVFGETQVAEFTATEIPSPHGEAYPGLVLLSWTTFQWTSEQGYDELFRAHEVAHQWWGIGVQPATYHDVWLSEGFAEFSGIWYTSRIRGSSDLALRRLKETREAILDRRGEAGPLWLGRRVGTSEHPEDYQTIVYDKGAWVLHMLRNLFLDPETGSEAAFTSMMTDFYTTYLGNVASIGQFEAIVEKHMGAPMDWFFDQWVYGTSIPTYTFSYTLAEQDDGTYKATIRVRQENVTDDFQMIVPIDIAFGTQGSARVNVLVAGPVTEAELPVLPMKPTKLTFNPFESVLAETRTERWRN